DGPSQMGLEDRARSAAQPGGVGLCPSEAVCTHWLTAQAADHQGMVYIRTGRPKTPILYKNDERFTIGGAKVLRESAKDRVTVVAAGVTVFEALEAHDEQAKRGIASLSVGLYTF